MHRSFFDSDMSWSALLKSRTTAHMVNFPLAAECDIPEAAVCPLGGLGVTVFPAAAGRTHPYSQGRFSILNSRFRSFIEYTFRCF